MFIDAHNEFSDAQAVTASAASENIIDLNAARRGAGVPLKIHAAVNTAFVGTGSTTLTISFQSSSAEAFSSPTTHWQISAVDEADLVAGKRFELPPVPDDAAQYGRLYYTVGSGPFTAGKIDAALVIDKQTNHYEAMDEFIS